MPKALEHETRSSLFPSDNTNWLIVDGEPSYQEKKKKKKTARIYKNIYRISTEPQAESAMCLCFSSHNYCVKFKQMQIENLKYVVCCMCEIWIAIAIAPNSHLSPEKSP